MQPPTPFTLASPDFVIEAVPLTREAFAPFGDVVENPRPDVHPSFSSAHPSLPFNAVSANQGSAIKYQHVSHSINLYDQAPSGRPGQPAMNMFVCAARASLPVAAADAAPAPAPAPGPAPDLNPAPTSLPSTFPVSILERHPYTTQTFIPLTTTTQPHRHYLVIVAPTLPSPTDTKEKPPLPTPATLPPSTTYPRPLPGSGMPDLRNLRAFVATTGQAVTYGAGTWHAPMVALGPAGTALDFVVVQFANGVGVEDCQEVVLESKEAGGEEKGGNGGGVVVRLRALGFDGKRGGFRGAKL